MIPTPRYSVGDTVWAALSDTTVQPVFCPECNGTNRWTATSPSGITLEIECPACTWGRVSPQYPEFVAQPGVRRLTIGSVRVDTASDRPVEYMTVETGIGSGTVWDERRLFDTEEEAMRASVLLSQAWAYEQTERWREDYEQRLRKSNAAAAAREARRRKKRREGA